MAKIHVNYRLSEEDKRLIESLAKHLGFSETDIVKLAIREFAERAQEKRKISSRDFSEAE